MNAARLARRWQDASAATRPLHLSLPGLNAGAATPPSVIAGLDPAIQRFLDARLEAGHDIVARGVA
jgi:hypothetical protein